MLRESKTNTWRYREYQWGAASMNRRKNDSSLLGDVLFDVIGEFIGEIIEGILDLVWD